MNRPRGGRPFVVLAPSDVTRARSGTVRVGGRIAAGSDGATVLRDALVSLRVSWAAEPEARAGELVIVEGLARAGTLRNARIVERHAGVPGPEASRLAGERVGSHLASRDSALRALRSYFASEGFVEVETPVCVRSPGLDAHVGAFRAERGWLITSPELHMKRLLVGGLPRVFQVARVSRRDEAGDLHEPEFSLVEWYRAFAGFEDTLADTEALVVRVVRALTGATSVRRAGHRISVEPPFDRLTVRDAFRRHAGVADAVDLAARNPDGFFQAYVDHVEPALARARRPVFLVDYPVSQGALARTRDDDPTVVERYELFIGGVELCNGYGELTDAREQRSRFAAERRRRRQSRERAQPSDERFLAALEEGLPPCSGNALGFDRLVAVALDLPVIAGAMAFPDRER